jgi:hypothetical protein
MQILYYILVIGVSSCAKWIAYITGRWGLGGGGGGRRQVLLPRAPHTLGTPLPNSGPFMPNVRLKQYESTDISKPLHSSRGRLVRSLSRCMPHAESPLETRFFTGIQPFLLCRIQLRPGTTINTAYEAWHTSCYDCVWCKSNEKLNCDSLAS